MTLTLSLQSLCEEVGDTRLMARMKCRAQQLQFSTLLFGSSSCTEAINLNIELEFMYLYWYKLYLLCESYVYIYIYMYVWQAYHFHGAHVGGWASRGRLGSFHYKTDGYLLDPSQIMMRNPCPYAEHTWSPMHSKFSPQDLWRHMWVGLNREFHEGFAESQRNGCKISPGSS